MGRLETLTEAARELPHDHCYAVTRLALEELGGDIRTVPMPEFPHGLIYDSITDNYIVVRAPDDMSEMTVGKFISTTLAIFRGAKFVSIYFGTKD